MSSARRCRCVLGGLGLLASFFHLGHPERAWRAIAMWRTSWLSRECLCLPAFLACAFCYGVAHWFDSPWSLAIGWLGVLASAALFVCTAMIYACLRFLQEWATPLTLVNFVLLGCASGFTLATALSAWCAPALTVGLAVSACVLTLAGCASRSASLVRNARLRPKSTVQSATGIHNPKLVQVSRGFTAGAFNLREFFHGKSADAARHQMGLPRGGVRRAGRTDGARREPAFDRRLARAAGRCLSGAVRGARRGTLVFLRRSEAPAESLLREGGVTRGLAVAARSCRAQSANRQALVRPAVRRRPAS